jgi:hypothetical protein
LKIDPMKWRVKAGRVALLECLPARPVRAWRRDRWAIRADGAPGAGRGACGVPARCGDPVRPGGGDPGGLPWVMFDHGRRV